MRTVFIEIQQQPCSQKQIWKQKHSSMLLGKERKAQWPVLGRFLLSLEVKIE